MKGFLQILPFNFHQKAIIRLSKVKIPGTAAKPAVHFKHMQFTFSILGILHLQQPAGMLTI